MSSPVLLAAGRRYLAIPGPSVIPDAVLQAMHRPAPNIYAPELETLTESIVADLRGVARTRHDVAIYIGNGHAAWEASVVNTLAPGDLALAPCTGRFGHGWAGMAEATGVVVERMDFGKQTPIDPERVAERLAQDPQHRIKAILAVHVDTSTSIRNDIAALRAVLDRLDHPALLMVDCIASLACDRFEMDAWGVDVMVTACQKGLMVPPGLSFVFFGPRAAAARARLDRVSSYWDWAPRAAPQDFYQYYCGTAPTHHLFGLRAALDLIGAEGIEVIWERHAMLARAIWAACDRWGAGGALRLNVADPAHRSHAVTALSLEPRQGTALRTWVETHLGLTLGVGLGMAPPGDPAADAYFRLAHMGHVNGHMILGLIGGIEAGLSALGVARGAGAAEAAAAVISGTAPAGQAVSEQLQAS